MFGVAMKRPECSWSSAIKIYTAKPEKGYDPLMTLVKCANCGCEYWIAPPPLHPEHKDTTDLIQGDLIQGEEI